MVGFILEVLISIGKFLWQGLKWIGQGIKNTCVWVYRGAQYYAAMIVNIIIGDDPNHQGQRQEPK